MTLLFDPDADGIHCGALMIICFERLMPELLDAGRVHMIKAPSLRLTSPSLSAPVYAHAPTHHHEILQALRERGIDDYRSLGSLERELLTEQCLLPETRSAKAVTRDKILPNKPFERSFCFQRKSPSSAFSKQ
ncbi:MAG: DNA gyrase subunit B [Granulosicoccus sp.]